MSKDVEVMVSEQLYITQGEIPSLPKTFYEEALTLIILYLTLISFMTRFSFLKPALPLSLPKLLQFSNEKVILPHQLFHMTKQKKI